MENSWHAGENTNIGSSMVKCQMSGVDGNESVMG